MAISLALMGLMVGFASVYWIAETDFASFGLLFVDWLADRQFVSFRFSSLFQFFSFVGHHLGATVLV